MPLNFIIKLQKGDPFVINKSPKIRISLMIVFQTRTGANSHFKAKVGIAILSWLSLSFLPPICYNYIVIR